MKKAAIVTGAILLLVSASRMISNGQPAPATVPVYTPVLNSLAFTYFTEPAPGVTPHAQAAMAGPATAAAVAPVK